jgi:hypothetical protein
VECNLITVEHLLPLVISCQDKHLLLSSLSLLATSGSTKDKLHRLANHFAFLFTERVKDPGNLLPPDTPELLHFSFALVGGRAKYHPSVLGIMLS